MTETVLEQTLEELRGSSRQLLKNTYSDILRRIKDNPADARFTEQNRLTAYYLELTRVVEAGVTEAFEKDGLKWPGLVWGESVEPKLQQPDFQYCLVLTSEDGINNSNDEKNLPPRGANDDKFLQKEVGSAGAAALGLVLRIASGHVESTVWSSFLSTTGTILLAGGVACCVFTVFNYGKQMRNTESIEGKEGIGSDTQQSSQVNLKTLMEEQFKVNDAVMSDWFCALSRYAREAETAAEKIQT